MKGTVRSYLPEKQYGFIKGDDGRDYFFHEHEFRSRDQIRHLCEDARIDFEQQATPKGYRATNCSLIDPRDVITYAIPDEFITSRSNGVPHWEIIEYGHWIVHGTSRNSPDEARRNAVDSAKRTGANALVGFEYYKTTGSESGTGSGIHYFTIHHFRGQLATVARKNTTGAFRREQLLGLDERTEALKSQLVARTRESRRKRNLIWFIVLVLSIVSVPFVPALVITWILLGFFLGRATDYDGWLRRV